MPCRADVGCSAGLAEITALTLACVVDFDVLEFWVFFLHKSHGIHAWVSESVMIQQRWCDLHGRGKLVRVRCEKFSDEVTLFDAIEAFTGCFCDQSLQTFRQFDIASNSIQAFDFGAVRDVVTLMFNDALCVFLGTVREYNRETGSLQLCDGHEVPSKLRRT